MDNSYLLDKAAWPGGPFVLIVFGGFMIVLALYSSEVSTRELFSRCNICVELKNQFVNSRVGKVLIRKNQDDAPAGGRERMWMKTLTFLRQHSCHLFNFQSVAIAQKLRLQSTRALVESGLMLQ